MAEIVHNRAGTTVVKVVYYGAAYAGKTTALQFLLSHLDPRLRGSDKLLALPPVAEDGDRTLYFDLMPVREIPVQGRRVSFQFWTLPGQPHMSGTRKLVVKNSDAIVFIADSQYDRAAANMQSFVDLQENLKKDEKCLKGFENEPGNQGLFPIPWVLFFNKRDMDGMMPVSYMDFVFEVQQRAILRYYGSCLTGENVFRCANTVLYHAVEDGVLSQLRSGAAP
jgi:mutual gliding-motility protein MglA